MEYDLNMYNEDMAISSWVFSKRFSNLIYYKDDLIQSSIIALYRLRSNYDNSKGSYCTFAYMVSYQSMVMFLRKEKRQTNNFNNLSLDYEFVDDNSLSDFFGYEFDFDSKINYEYLIDICNEVINSHKSKRLQSICRLFILGEKPSHIAKKLNITRQCACRNIDNFKNLVQKKLKEYDFELQTNICNKKVIQ